MLLRFTRYNFLPLAILLFAFTSCDVINPDEDIPGYLKINQVSLITEPLTEGSNSHHIVDVWVYIDGTFAGAFELPATIPLLYEGQHDIQIKPGIMVSGIAGTRGYYPFYQSYESHITIDPAVVTLIDPTFRYYTDVVNWTEDFESSGISIERFLDSDTSMEKTSDVNEVFEGSSSGVIHLTAEKDYFLGLQSQEIQLPKDQTPIFLEMDYKTNNRFNVGIYALEPGQTTRIPNPLTVNRKDTWNKLYINLTSWVNSVSTTNEYKFYIEAYKETDVEFPAIFFDNLKLVYNKP